MIISLSWMRQQKAVVNASNGDKIYGVIINTTDGTTYALRHLENIWKEKELLVWSTGFTTESHGCLNKL